jgi:AcrR family transcriptional regulator
MPIAWAEPEDKATSHERIGAIAAARIRESGTEQPGVAEIMRAAGLTHGGFYKHFGSRDELLAEAVERALADSEPRLVEIAAGAQDPLRRFAWPCPGDLLHMDTKRLARFTRPGHAVTGDRHRTGAEKRAKVGWEFCHSIVDDHSLLAYTELCPDETAATVTAFVERALDWFAGHGIHPRRLQTDNAFSYVKNRSLRELLAARGIQHRRIPPRTPKHNGKVERYQQTLAREWADGQRYRDSTCRALALPIWLNHYDTKRNLSSLSNRPPITRVRKQPRQNI